MPRARYNRFSGNYVYEDEDGGQEPIPVSEMTQEQLDAQGPPIHPDLLSPPGPPTGPQTYLSALAPPPQPPPQTTPVDFRPSVEDSDGSGSLDPIDGYDPGTSTDSPIPGATVWQAPNGNVHVSPPARPGDPPGPQVLPGGSQGPDASGGPRPQAVQRPGGGAPGTRTPAGFSVPGLGVPAGGNRAQWRGAPDSPAAWLALMDGAARYNVRDTPRARGWGDSGPQAPIPEMLMPGAAMSLGDLLPPPSAGPPRRPMMPVPQGGIPLPGLFPGIPIPPSDPTHPAHGELDDEGNPLP